MGGWCHWCFPVRYSCNGVNLAARRAITVQPHPMKDTLVPPPSIPPSLVSFSLSSLSFTSCRSLWSSSLRFSHSLSYIPTFAFFFLFSASQFISFSNTVNPTSPILSCSKYVPPVSDTALHEDISIIVLWKLQQTPWLNANQWHCE